MEFIIFLNKLDKDILELIKKANYSCVEIIQTTGGWATIVLQS